MNLKGVTPAEPGRVDPIALRALASASRLRRRRHWIVRPRVLRIARPQIFSHLRISVLPEAGQVIGYLNGTIIRSEQFQHHGHASAGDARSLLQSEELLKTHCQPHRFSTRILQSNPAAAWES